MTFDGEPFVLRQDLVKSHALPLAPHKSAFGQDGRLLCRIGRADPRNLAAAAQGRPGGSARSRARIFAKKLAKEDVVVIEAIGRRRRGQRLHCGVPHGHYKAITFVFGLRLRGVVAPKAYDPAMNAETFETWLEHHLLPSLEEGDIAVLDNLKAHKSPRTAEILAKKNCTVRYRPYCPDFNPIEMAISKLKSTLGKSGRAHRRHTSRDPEGLRRSLQADRMRKLPRGLRV